MKVGERVIGLIALGSTVPMAYTAAELKLVNTLALQTATAIENARLFERTIQAAQEREQLLALHQAAELARAKLESEMKLAARIQADLFPAELPQPDGYHLAARNRPARRCGGDYYDALTLRRRPRQAQERLLLCVADVSGKGLPAALLMSNMQATLARAARSRPVAAVAGRARQRSAVRGDVAGKVRHRGAGRARTRDGPAALCGRRASGQRDPARRRIDRVAGLHRRAAGPAPARAAVRRDQRGAATRRRAGAVFRWRHRRAEPPATKSSASRACTTSCERWRVSPPRPSSIACSTTIETFVADTPQFDDMTMLVVRRT